MFVSGFIPSRPLYAQASLTLDITAPNRPQARETIPIYSISGIPMVAVADVVNALRLKNTPTAADLNLIITRGNETFTAVLRPQNHFVAIKSQAAIVQTIQLSIAPLMDGGRIYLPPDPLAKLMSQLLRANISYADGKMTALLASPVAITTPPVAPPPSPQYTPPKPADSVKTAEPPKATDTAKPSVATVPSTAPTVIPKPVPLPATPVETLDSRFTIARVSIDTKANGAILRILATKPDVQYEFIRPNESGVAYLTFVKASGDLKVITQSFSSGLIKRITATPIKSSLQLTFEFDTRKYKIKSTEFKREEGSSHFVLLVLSDVDVKEIYKSEKEKKIGQALQEQRERWKLDVIALDAGHGGKDGGAQGAGGTAEKNVALGIILKVGKLISTEWPEVKVVYTRKEDVFIPLDERGKIANRANAKLFVSVHCNASLNRNADGTEVYLLGLHKTDAALSVAQRENAVIVSEDDYKARYKDFTDENIIMFTMAQSAFSQQSQQLADLVNKNIVSRAALLDRGVKQAGFMVLWTPSMPSILIETGFITNTIEEKFLASAAGQEKLSQAIFAAIKKYKSDYESQATD